LLSATRNNVQTNYGGRQKLIDMLAEQDSTLPYAIAGQAANSLAPRGVVARGGLMAAGVGGTVAANPLAVLALPAFSPRAVGESAYYFGKARGAGSRALDALHLDANTIRELERAGYQGGRNALAGGQ
jgi:hypothetical protein